MKLNLVALYIVHRLMVGISPNRVANLKNGIQLDDLHLGGESGLADIICRVVGRSVAYQFHDTVAVKVGNAYGAGLPGQTRLTILTSAKLYQLALTRIHYMYLCVVHEDDAHALGQVLLTHRRRSRCY